MTDAAIEFCDDAQLGYVRKRTRLAPGAALVMDDSYRLDHLPLVAPDHPRVIASAPGKPYERGRHAKFYSLTLPVDADALDASPAFAELMRELSAARFAQKIAWDILPRRRARLHATLCGSLGAGESPPAIDAHQRAALRAAGPFHVELRGLFSGDVNTGRLYLRAYPERRDGRNAIAEAQRAMGRPATDLYVVGLVNFLDDLAPDETAEFAALLERWWDRPFLRYRVDALWLLGSCDDLVLDAAVVETISLA